MKKEPLQLIDKNEIIEEFELALKESAFDCELIINRNSYKTDKTKLICKY